MFAGRDQAIYDCVRRGASMPTERLDAIRGDGRAAGSTLARALLDRGAITKPDLLAGIAEQLGCACELQTPASVPAEVVAQIPAGLARKYGVVPIRTAPDGTMDLLASDPFDDEALADLAFVSGRAFQLVVGDPDEIRTLVNQSVGDDPVVLEELLREVGDTDAAGPSTDVSIRVLESIASQAPIVRFVNLVLAEAVRAKASDVHFEPFEDEFRIRRRVDGVLHDLPSQPRRLALAIASRLKVMANLDIAERRIPQDGRIRLHVGSRSVDLRMSTLPTQFGESVVLRVLDSSAMQLDLADLGMAPDVLAGVRQAVRRPNGIFLVTGPTGSGKTTTLYSGLREINSPDVKIVTAEDPVEYNIEGLMQVAVNPASGLTFASALRSFLRQDPDVLMVGEIRDLETAQIATQAALTGHFVLSTLHTNDATGAISRLVDMGVEPFLIASTVHGVLAQRLVRRICPACRTTCRPAPELLARLDVSVEDAEAHQFFRGAGCTHCNRSGYRGRSGIFEWLRITAGIRELITAKASAQVIRERAIAEGMRTLRDDGWRAVLDGSTTVEEMLNAT